jgi:hypothetical protein
MQFEAIDRVDLVKAFNDQGLASAFDSFVAG